MYQHRDDSYDDDTKCGVEMVGHASQDLAPDDTVKDEEALHGEYIKCARDHRAIVPGGSSAKPNCRTRRFGTPPRIAGLNHRASPELRSENGTANTNSVTSSHQGCNVLTSMPESHRSCITVSTRALPTMCEHART